MIGLNFERTNPSEHTCLGSELCRRISPKYHLDRNPIDGMIYDSIPSSIWTRPCRAVRTFTAHTKSYPRIFQCASTWNFTRGAHAILEMDSNVD